jgi:hypothetical protein
MKTIVLSAEKINPKKAYGVIYERGRAKAILIKTDYHDDRSYKGFCKENFWKGNTLCNLGELDSQGGLEEIIQALLKKGDTVFEFPSYKEMLAWFIKD